MESQEGGVPDVGKAGKEVPVCAWHQHTGREGVLVHGVAPEQEEAEQVSGDCVHFLKDNFFVNTEHLHLPVIVWMDISCKLTPLYLLFDKYKETLPKALRTQVLTALYLSL